MRFISARSALGRGSGGGLALPQESISLKKSPSDLEILLSYDRAHTVVLRKHHGISYECTHNVSIRLR